jgi:Zn-dependent protease
MSGGLRRPTRQNGIMTSGFVGYLTVSLAAVILHELGHAIVATATGIRIKRIGISWRGPYLVREQGPPIASFFTALAGPVLNVMLGVWFLGLAPQFSLVNLVLGAYNMLPFVPGLDGYNALAAYRKMGSLRQNRPA